MGGRNGRGDPTAGWPSGRHSPITPQGRAEQADKFLSGLARQRGWRRVAARAGAAVALLVILALIAVSIASAIR